MAYSVIRAVKRVEASIGEEVEGSEAADDGSVSAFFKGNFNNVASVIVATVSLCVSIFRVAG